MYGIQDYGEETEGLSVLQDHLKTVSPCFGCFAASGSCLHSFSRLVRDQLIILHCHASWQCAALAALMRMYLLFEIIKKFRTRVETSGSFSLLSLCCLTGFPCLQKS